MPALWEGRAAVSTWNLATYAAACAIVALILLPYVVALVDDMLEMYRH